MLNRSGDSSPVGRAVARDGNVVGDSSAAVHPGGNATLEAATRLHALSRKRAFLFNTPAMADSAMDIMLSVLIAHQQNVQITHLAIAMANRLPQEKCEAFLEALALAGLISHKGPGNTVHLTVKGLDQMQDYIKNFG
jgi:predicted transcriptional regulator